MLTNGGEMRALEDMGSRNHPFRDLALSRPNVRGRTAAENRTLDPLSQARRCRHERPAIRIILCGDKLTAITGHAEILSALLNVNGNLEPLRLCDRPTENARQNTRRVANNTYRGQFVVSGPMGASCPKCTRVTFMIDMIEP